MSDIDPLDGPSLGRRVLALLIDWGIALLTASLLFGIRPGDPVETFWDASAAHLMFVIQVSVLVGLLGFSIGKRIMGLRVINVDGAPIGVPRAILRTFLLSLIIPAILMTEDKRGLHDLAVGSKEIRA